MKRLLNTFSLQTLFISSLSVGVLLGLSASIKASQETAKVSISIDSGLEAKRVSALNRPIDLIRVKSLSLKKTAFKVYIQGNLHGNEQMTSRFVRWMMTRIKVQKGPLSEYVNQGVVFDFMPEANPDGVALISRYNSNKINLNRNFSMFWSKLSELPGPAAFSEKETQAIRNVFKKNKYDLAIDIHGYINWVVAPSVHSEGSPEKLKLLRSWTQSLENNFSKMGRKTEMKTALGLGDGGAFEDWAFWKQGVLSYCLEMDHPLKNNLTSKQWRKRLKSYERYIAATVRDAMILKSSTRVH